MLNRHVLVTGAHRSGTTWVGQTIAHHSNIVYFQEPFNVNEPNRAFGYHFDATFYYVPGSGREECIHAAFARLFRSVIHPYRFAINKCKSARLDLKIPLRFGKYLLRGLYLPKRALIKDPFALMSAGWLHACFGLQVICMIRNPVAFAGSLKKANWPFDFHHLKQQKHLVKAYFPTCEAEIHRFCEAPRDIIDHACLLWNILHSVILRHRETYPHWLFLRHEDLARNPITGFQKIFEYLGLRMTAKIRTIIETYTSASNAIETNSPAYMPRNARGSLDTWRTRLTPAEIERVIHDTRDVAGRFYHLQGNEFV
jgi:hypothetical protein